MAGCIIIRIGPIEGVDIDMTLFFHPKKLHKQHLNKLLITTLTTKQLRMNFKYKRTMLLLKQLIQSP